MWLIRIHCARLIVSSLCGGIQENEKKIDRKKCFNRPFAIFPVFSLSHSFSLLAPQFNDFPWFTHDILSSCFAQFNRIFSVCVCVFSLFIASVLNSMGAQCRIYILLPSRSFVLNCITVRNHTDRTHDAPNQMSIIGENLCKGTLQLV